MLNIITVRKRLIALLNQFLDIIDGKYKVPYAYRKTYSNFLTPKKIINEKLGRYQHKINLYLDLDPTCQIDIQLIRNCDREYIVSIKQYLEVSQRTSKRIMNQMYSNFRECNIAYILDLINSTTSPIDNLAIANKIDQVKELTTRSKIKLLKTQTKKIGGPKIEPYLTKYLLKYPKQSEYYTYWVYKEGEVIYEGINKPDTSQPLLKNGLVEKKFHAEEYRQAIEEHFETKERELELKLQQELEDVPEDTAKLVQIAKLILRTDNTNIHAVINATKQIFLELN